MDNRKNAPLLVVAGPTASGKTALAVWLAKRLNGEVVSADSMQIYAEPRIATARPTEAEMDGVPHHLIGTVSLREPYSVARYADEARAAIEQVRCRGRLPILCGGTGLYIQAITENLQFSPQEDTTAVREALRRRLEQEGGEALLAELRTVDPAAAERLHPNNTGRIIRALEVFQTTGETISEQQRRSRAVPPPFETVFLLLDFHDREVLYERIDRRVEAMLTAGLEEEARRVRALGQAPTAAQAIGYKELYPYFDGVLTREQAVANIKQSTRRYAKRQLSWFHRLPGVHTIYVDDGGVPQQADIILKGENL